MAINIFENHNIKNNNSFGLDLKCKKFIEYREKEDIINFIKENRDILKKNFWYLETEQIYYLKMISMTE